MGDYAPDSAAISILEGSGPTVGGMLGGPVGALIGAGASGIFNAFSARRQEKFQERMANTAYQRAAKDLEAAGLNRILALGSPGATPSGSSAQAPDFAGALSRGEEAVTGRGKLSIDKMIAGATVENLNAQANSAQAVANTQASVQELNAALKNKADREAENIQQQKRLNQTTADKLETQNKAFGAMSETQKMVYSVLSQIFSGAMDVKELVK